VRISYSSTFPEQAEHVVMMGMPGPPGEGAFLHAGFAGEQWGDDFAAGPPVAGPAMHAQWCFTIPTCTSVALVLAFLSGSLFCRAEEMAMQRSHAGAARTAAMRQGPMMCFTPSHELRHRYCKYLSFLAWP
jgi:hypothetical protein